jgi:transglutaminase-like putative cysteine protease
MASQADLWHASCSIAFDVSVSTPMVFMLRPRSIPGQWVARETYDLSPAIDVIEFADGFGNLCQRLVAPVGEFAIQTSVDVVLRTASRIAEPDGNLFVEVPDVPNAALTYLLPSRYCESDRFGDMATSIIEGCTPGAEQVVRITDWVRENVRNTPLSSTYPVSAIEINQRREGVCRDLAHVGIALCRAICIPARLVVGYLHGLEPMDIHAWFEAFVGGGWRTFDPSCQDLSAARISIAHGRDAADVAIYNQYGPLLLPRGMRVTMERGEERMGSTRG